MKKLIVANWKMHPKSVREARLLMKGIVGHCSRYTNARIAIAPPFPYLSFFPKTKNITLAAQNVSWEQEGSFTGEVSSSMLKSERVVYVIIGHSERRKHLLETDDMVNKKVRHAVSVGLWPIVCVGEDKRDTDGKFFHFIKGQVVSALKRVSKRNVQRIAIAYEPLWSISPGKPARPEDAREAAIFIKKIIAQLYGVKIATNFRILYGGSANAKNAESYLAIREIGGLLVGRESRSVKDFTAIVRCAHIKR